mmetsp:Transcript_2813/g.7059  ORF Transcript_2813/g.7059 Transcript_2813/m.7059 type:complete len:108 (+) Transcript_2813:567-890(+)
MALRRQMSWECHLRELSAIIWSLHIVASAHHRFAKHGKKDFGAQLLLILVLQFVYVLLLVLCASRPLLVRHKRAALCKSPRLVGSIKRFQEEARSRFPHATDVRACD